MSRMRKSKKDNEPQSKSWDDLKGKVQAVCEDIEGMDREDQLRATSILESQVNSLLSQLGNFKNRLSSGAEKEDAEHQDKPDETPVTKRRPGRPRRQSQQSSHSAKEDSEVTPKPTGRGRGRPRKSVPATETSSETASAIETPRRGRKPGSKKGGEEVYNSPESSPDDEADVKCETPEVIVSRTGRLHKKRHIFDPSETDTSFEVRKNVAIDNKASATKRKKVSLDTSPSPRPSNDAEEEEEELVNELTSQENQIDKEDIKKEQSESTKDKTDESAAGEADTALTESEQHDKAQDEEIMDGESGKPEDTPRPDEAQPGGGAVEDAAIEDAGDLVKAEIVKDENKAHNVREHNGETRAKPVTETKPKTASGRPRGRPPTSDKTFMVQRFRRKPGVPGRRGRPRNSDYSDVLVTSYKIQRKCDICDKNFSSNTALLNHQAIHKPDSKIQCPDCDKTFFTRPGLYTHRRKHHTDDTALFKCTNCVFTTRTQESLDYHYSMRHDQGRPKNYVCHLCGKAFHKSATLENHVQAVHLRDKRYSCDECDFVTHFIGCLNAHKRTRHNPSRRVYPCDLCDSKLSSKAEFRLHMNRHAGFKPYPCTHPNCKASFVSNSQLATHRRCMHEARKHECPVCKKRFPDKHKVQRHILVHTGEKAFTCPYCTYKCNVQANLRKHCKNVHQKTYPPRTHFKVSDRRLGSTEQQPEVTNAKEIQLEVADSRELPVAEHLIAMAAGNAVCNKDIYSSLKVQDSVSVECQVPESLASTMALTSLPQAQMVEGGCIEVAAVGDTEEMQLIAAMASAHQDNKQQAPVTVEYVQEGGASYTNIKNVVLAGVDAPRVECEEVVANHQPYLSGGQYVAVSETGELATCEQLVMLQTDEGLVGANPDDPNQLILPNVSQQDLVLVVEADY